MPVKASPKCGIPDNAIAGRPAWPSRWPGFRAQSEQTDGYFNFMYHWNENSGTPFRELKLHPSWLAVRPEDSLNRFLAPAELFALLPI